MPMKTIRITEAVYDRLIARKREDESISELLDRLTGRDDQFERGFGAYPDIDFERHVDSLNHRLDGEIRGN